MGRNNSKSSSDWEVLVQRLMRLLSCSQFLPIRLERNTSVEACEPMNKLCLERNVTKKRGGWTHVLHGQLPDKPFSLFLMEFQSLELFSPLALLWLKTSSLPNSVFSPAILPSLSILLCIFSIKTPFSIRNVHELCTKGKFRRCHVRFYISFLPSLLAYIIGLNTALRNVRGKGKNIHLLSELFILECEHLRPTIPPSIVHTSIPPITCPCIKVGRKGISVWATTSANTWPLGIWICTGLKEVPETLLHRSMLRQMPTHPSLQRGASHIFLWQQTGALSLQGAEVRSAGLSLYLVKTGWEDLRCFFL